MTVLILLGLAMFEGPAALGGEDIFAEIAKIDIDLRKAQIELAELKSREANGESHATRVNSLNEKVASLLKTRSSLACKHLLPMEAGLIQQMSEKGQLQKAVGPEKPGAVSGERTPAAVRAREEAKSIALEVNQLGAELQKVRGEIDTHHCR